jgi:cytochrome bd-type quinol oxidase subunit 2
LLPFVGTVVAFTLSVRLGLMEGCNPFVDGCVSISRAARLGLPNQLFRALLLPAAALQALCWLLCDAWLRSLGAARTRKLRALPWIGCAAAVFLVLYGTFLGTEGEAYRWMRRYGVAVYFGGSCIAMLIVSGASQGLAQHTRAATRALLVLCTALPFLGLANAFAPLLHPSDAARAALQNCTEWWGGLIFTLFFAALAWLWHATRFEIRLVSGREHHP